MKDAQKPDHVSLTALVHRLREGRYVIPDFQREFEWKPWDIRELLRSVFLDYYIGSLLLWKGKAESFSALSCEPLRGFEGKGEPTHIVLDGQQRLTALHYAFFAPDVPLPSRQNRFLFFIRVDHFMEEEHDLAFEYDWTRRGVRLLDDHVEQFRQHMFPLSIVGAGGFELPNWLQDYKRHWSDQASGATAAGDEEAATTAARHATNAHSFGEHVRAIIEQYQISYVELDKELALDKVCDIFTQINSRGIRLDIFDLVNALLKPKGLELKRLWRSAKGRLDFVKSERLNVYILQVMSILRQSYCSPKYLYYLLPGQERKVRGEDGSLRREVLIPTAKDFEAKWNEAVEALVQSVTLLRHPQEYGAIRSDYLPYASILPVFAAARHAATSVPPNRRLDADRKLRHWYWASVFLNRYSGSVESTSARDFMDLTRWFDDDEAEPAMISEFQSGFRGLDLKGERKSGTSVYNGVFNLLVLNGARDWMAGGVAQSDDLDDHHVVPKSRAAELGVGSNIDTILNRTPLTAETNRNFIRDRLPNDYLPELIGQNGEGRVRAMLESSLVSPLALDILLRRPFTGADFEAFIAERRQTILAAIESLLIKERLVLPAQLRELDGQVEIVELALRRLVCAAVGDDEARIPSHVMQKVNERLAAAGKRNAALDEKRYATLLGKLDFADLRELEAVITSNSLGGVFASTFPHKEKLVQRFAQLAELRNGIRHSRAVDEVTRKEGEAALVWFQKTLSL